MGKKGAEGGKIAKMAIVSFLTNNDYVYLGCVTQLHFTGSASPISVIRIKWITKDGHQWTRLIVVKRSKIWGYIIVGHISDELVHNSNH
jgi:hypothetical protein